MPLGCTSETGVGKIQAKFVLVTGCEVDKETLEISNSVCNVSSQDRKIRRQARGGDIGIDN